MMLHQTITRSLFAVLAFGALLVAGCKSDTTTPNTGSYQITYLVSDTAAYGNNVRIDPNLKNAWGIAVGPTGYFWISSTEANVSTVYDLNGVEQHAPVPIPSRDSVAGGNPTGQIYNSTGGFKSSLFIFAGEDGSLSSWKSPDASALRMYANPSPDAVYKGIAMAKDGNIDYLYVTNFKEGKVEVFDGNFSPVGGRPFANAYASSGFAPFGIANIDGKLYVTYAKQKGPDNEDDLKGAGNGYVDIFNADGTLYKHFAMQGSLNSPWGIAKAPSSGFGDTFKDAILIGNFGDGAINAFNASDGSFLGQLKDINGNVLKIDGLWAIVFSSAGSINPSTLYFSAGPYEEEHGLFGNIIFK